MRQSAGGGSPFNKIIAKFRQLFNKGGKTAPRAKSSSTSSSSRERGEHEHHTQSHAVDGHPSADTIGQAARITEA